MAGERQAYVYGNTVRQPDQGTGHRHKKRLPKPHKKVSKQVQKNRKKAMHMNVGYVMFLSVAALAAVMICMQYLPLRSELTKRSQNITKLQQELAELKEENNTMYNAAVDSVNLEKVRESAVNEFGMVYAVPEQIIEYDSPSSDYVRQYQNIPKSGVLAQSAKPEN